MNKNFFMVVSVAMLILTILVFELSAYGVLMMCIPFFITLKLVLQPKEDLSFTEEEIKNFDRLIDYEQYDLARALFFTKK